jgi:Gpi18-like mannosyltransferase
MRLSAFGSRPDAIARVRTGHLEVPGLRLKPAVGRRHRAQGLEWYDWVSSSVLMLAGIATACALLPLAESTGDLQHFYIPWMTEVSSNGVSSITGEFSDYTPPYIYLLLLFSVVVPFTGMVAAIKLISAPFVAALALGLYLLIKDATADTRRALWGGAIACVLPTVLVNAFLWGQTDIIYTTLLVYFTYFASRGRPLMAALIFGIAFSFKAQSLFLSPFLLYLVFSGQMRLIHLLAIPLTYVVMMTPAALTGRSWAALLFVYVEQFGTYHRLSLSAPNPWLVVDLVLDYQIGVMMGIALSLAAGLMIAIGSNDVDRHPRNNLIVAVMCAAVMPYVLPKMHERYFFVADVFSLALALTVPRLWTTAVLFQIGSLLSYLQYFGFAKGGPALGLVPITIGLARLSIVWMQARAAWQSPSNVVRSLETRI